MFIVVRMVDVWHHLMHKQCASGVHQRGEEALMRRAEVSEGDAFAVHRQRIAAYCSDLSHNGTLVRSSGASAG